jgi:hypothetical protein
VRLAQSTLLDNIVDPSQLRWAECIRCAERYYWLRAIRPRRRIAISRRSRCTGAEWQILAAAGGPPPRPSLARPEQTRRSAPASIYGWFTEGFDTPGPLGHRLLLDQLT